VPRANDVVEAVLVEYADLLSITSDDPFKARAYEKAARAVGGYHADVATMDLKAILAIPNVGKSIGEKIHEYLTTGQIQALEDLREQIPDGVRQLLSVPGLGPKKAMVVYRELGIASVDELLDAVQDHRLAELRGFGEKTEENVRRGIRQVRESGGRVLISLAMDLAEELLAELEPMREVLRASYAGSLRRSATSTCSSRARTLRR
jgi:DNA polymerase (family 10)